MNAEEVTLSPAKGELVIGTSRLVVRERSYNKEIDFLVEKQMASVFGAIVRRIRRTRSNRTKPIQIGTASLADIEKALAPKKHSDPRKKLPEHYHDFLPLFDRTEADRLPPYRQGIDHEIPLEKDTDGQEKTPP